MVPRTQTASGLRTTSSARRSARTAELRLVDWLAPAVVVLFVILQFQPFWQIAILPGSMSSLVLPSVAVGTLLLTPATQLRSALISLPLLALVGWEIASRLWSVSPADTDYAIRSGLPALVLTVTVAATIPPARLVRVLVATFAIIVAWSLLYSLAVPEGRVGIIGNNERQLGFRGTFIHKNHFGIFATYGLAIVLPFVTGRARGPLIALCAIAVVGTRSATAASGLFIVSFSWMWIAAIGRQRKSRERTLLLALSVTSAVVGVLTALRLLPTLLGLYDKDLTFSGRTTIWSEAVRLIADRPWTGYGLGGVFVGDPPAMTVELWRRIGFEAAHAHNGAIGLLLEVGWIGLALAAAVVVQVVIAASKCAGNPALSSHWRWAMVTLLALLLMSVSEPLFSPADLGYLGLVWVACAGVSRERTSATHPDGDGHPGL